MKYTWILVLCMLLALAMTIEAQTVSETDSLDGSWAEMYRFFDEPVDPDTYLIRPGEDLLASVGLHTPHLGVAVPAITAGADALLVCHGPTP